jgi:arylsulfatase A-like enzyme
VRRLVGALDDERDDTIVIVVSDHGESLDELIARYAYGFDHGEFLYAHQHHVPWIWALPDGSRGVHEEPVSTVDLTPTLLDLLDVPYQADMFGRSLAGRLTGDAVEGSAPYAQRRSFKGEHRDALRGDAFSLVRDDWHLIFGASTGPELYDLATDVREERNVFATHETVGGQLLARLTEFQTVVRTPLVPSQDSADDDHRAKLRALGYLE